MHKYHPETPVFVVLMCKLFMLTTLMYENPKRAGQVDACTPRLENLSSTHHSKYEQRKNDKIEITESTSNMDVNVKNRSHLIAEEVHTHWGSSDILNNHLHDNNTMDNKNTHKNQNTDDLNYEYYYNYDEIFPFFNASTFPEYEMWKESTLKRLQNELAGYSYKLQPGDNIESLFDRVRHNLSSLSLNEIIVLEKEIFNNRVTANNNYSENYSQSSESLGTLKWRPMETPPWENLTSEEKLNLIKTIQGAPQRFNNATTIGLTYYYGVLLLIGIGGNVLTIFIIVTNAYMRTAPNFFLLSIALSDLVTLTIGKKKYIC